MADLMRIVDRLAGRLGTVGGEPVPLDGGITNRNYRVRFGERDCVLRLPGRDTDLDAQRFRTCPHRFPNLSRTG